MTSAVPEPGNETCDEARAQPGKRLVWLAPPQLPPWPVVWFLLEGDPRHGEPDRALHLWGLAVDDGESEPEIEVISSELGDDGGRRAWKRFVVRAGGILERHPHARWVHYSDREMDRLRHYVARYGAPAGFLEHVEEASFDLLARGVRRSVRLPHDSDSLGEVAGCAGFHWRNPDSSPAWSVVQHRKARASTDPAERARMLKEVVGHTAHGLLAMRAVWRWLLRDGPRAYCG